MNNNDRPYEIYVKDHAAANTWKIQTTIFANGAKGAAEKYAGTPSAKPGRILVAGEAARSWGSYPLIAQYDLESEPRPSLVVEEAPA